MHICYLDESGTPEDSGTSHFVVLGLAIPAHSWKRIDRQVERIKLEHRLTGVEIHTAWMLRQYPEQERVADFESLSEDVRRSLTPPGTTLFSSQTPKRRPEAATEIVSPTHSSKS